MSSWFGGKSNKEKFKETFKEEVTTLEPIILYGIDITYMKKSEIYQLVKDYRN